MADFESAAAEFVKLLSQRGLPPHLLWAGENDILLWRGRYHVRGGSVQQRRARARTIFETNPGVWFEVLCQTRWLTICRTQVVADPAAIQHPVADNPPRATIVESALWWWVLARLGSRPSVCVTGVKAAHESSG